MSTEGSGKRRVEDCLQVIRAQRDALKADLDYVRINQTTLEKLIVLRRLMQAAAVAQQAAAEAWEMVASGQRTDPEMVEMVKQYEFPFVAPQHETFHG